MKPLSVDELPKRLAELRELISAPDVVHEDVETALLRSDAREQGLDLGGEGVIRAVGNPPPARAVTISAVSSMVSGRPGVAPAARVLRPEQYTIAPAAPSAVAMPRPAPRVAPATTATFPCSGGI